MDARIDEKNIINLFNTKWSLQLKKIKEGKDKKPDFKGIVNNETVFYAELKTIMEDQWYNNDNETVRNDPVLNRISNKIYEAYSQLIQINKNHSIPNILIFLNYDYSINCSYMTDILTGTHFVESGNHQIGFYNRFRERIKDKMSFIDLYIWIDKRNNKPLLRFWGTPGDGFHDLLCLYFNINLSDVKSLVDIISEKE